MSHLSDEDLILHFYGEHATAASVDEHLGVCPECRAAAEALRNDLRDVALEAPPRGQDYGHSVWERLEPSLPGRRGSSRPTIVPLRSRRWARRAVAAAAIAASLVIAFLVGRNMRPEPGKEAASAAARERILLVAVGDHLDRTQMLLVELAHSESEDTGGVSARAADFVAANRLYRVSAERAGEVGLASVLDEVERVLVEAANAPGPLSADQVRDLNDRIESKGLLFKVRVLGSQLRERQTERRPKPSAPRPWQEERTRS
jgi:hypothetical protein